MKSGMVKLSMVSLASALLLSAMASPDLEAKNVKLRFWHFFNGTRVPLMNKMITDFEKKYPNIDVEQMVGNPNDRHTKLLTSVAAGSPVDVIMLGRQDVPSYVNRRVLRPLDSYMAQDKISPDIFYKQEFLPCQYQGKTWILPNVSGSGQSMLFYNKDAFREVGLNPEKPPATWDELEIFSKKLMQLSGPGQLKRIGFNASWDMAQLKGYIYSNKGEWLSSDGKKSLLDSPKVIETVKWITGFWGKVYDTAKFGVPDAWYKGAQTMFLSGTWEMFYLKSKDAKFRYGIGRMPAGDGGQGRGVVEGGWGYAIPGNAKNPQESWELVKYLTATAEGAGWFYKEQLRTSPVKKFNSDPYYKEHVEDWDKISDIMEGDINLPVTPVSPDLDKVLTQMMSDVNGKKKSPDSAVKWADSESQKILDAYWKKAASRK